MRFSLQDVRKTVQRRGGDLYVSLHFLRPGVLRAEIERLIAYYEHLLGQPQRLFSLDEARAYVGEYRLAHCLMAVLSHWYVWRQREWAAVVQAMAGNAELAAVNSAVELRLALYHYVNKHYQGFLEADRRGEVLQAFAEQYHLSVVDLEYLLALDNENEALLTRDTIEPPSVQAVATLYDQWVFEAALFNASQVRFVIDCQAFAAARAQEKGFAATTVGAGVGAVMKRLCYLARKLGVYYDLAYEDEGATTNQEPKLLTLTLYGPQEVTGAPQQYGFRLARLCRLLLLQYPKTDRREKESSMSLPMPPDASNSTSRLPNASSNFAPGYAATKDQAGRKAKKSILFPAVVEAEARVHFLQRAYRFVLDTNLLQLLPAVAEGDAVAERFSTDAAQLFDSSIEQSFTEAFIGSANSLGVDGWQLEREPEPLLLKRSIFIPDFAFTRGSKRIYVEILGFWTPSYRERKIQKLQQLRAREDLLLAIPLEAKDAFADIADAFPIVYYTGQLSVTEVLQVLRSRYDDFSTRLANIDVKAVRARVQDEGFLSERVCYDLLGCYRRSELHQAAAQIIDLDEGIIFDAGIGLYQRKWLEQVQRTFVAWLQTCGVVRLAEAVREIKLKQTLLQDCADTTIETLLGLWAEISIQRDSIFDVTVTLADRVVPLEVVDVLSAEEAQSLEVTKKPRRTGTKKRVTNSPEAVQGDLWN